MYTALVTISLCNRLSVQPCWTRSRGQPVEQLGMRRGLALLAEIAGRGDDSAAEVMLPEAVDDHPRGQRPGPSTRCRSSSSPAPSRRMLVLVHPCGGETFQSLSLCPPRSRT